MTDADIRRARDELCGIIADAYVSGRKGADLSIALRRDFARVQLILEELLKLPREKTNDTGPKAGTNGTAKNPPSQAPKAGGP
jgi:hypothetical protein